MSAATESAGFPAVGAGFPGFWCGMGGRLGKYNMRVL